MAICMSPFHKRHDNENMALPCGKCPACLTTRKSAWSFRLMQESRVSDSMLFVTLTYAPEYVKKAPSGRLTLDKRDLTLFFKNLRNSYRTLPKNERPKIKYYVVGEYGSRFQRPHYHVILFNSHFDNVRKSWPHGHAQIEVPRKGEASIGYCLMYMDTPKTRRVPMYEGDDRQPLFAHMSLGLGASYLTPDMIAWHRADLENRLYIPLKDGNKASMPRYYKNRIYRMYELANIGVYLTNKAMEIEREEMLRNPDYLWNKEQAKLAAFERLRKKYLKTESKSIF
ncbi:MAG: replication initiator protein [Microvirus sp.]|nr:MAG: replication initiator protein [Microvirus sp.]